jgi:hypothetical protein
VNVLWYLAPVLAVVVIGFLLLLYRSRTPKGLDSGIRAHRRHMDALSGEARRDTTGTSGLTVVRRVQPDGSRSDAAEG